MYDRGTAAWLAVLVIGCGSGGPPHQGKTPAQLQQMLTSPDPVLRQHGALGLSQAGPAAREAVPALATALSDDVVGVRQNAALALERLGPEASGAAPALTRALNDKEWMVRRQAALALGALGDGSAKPLLTNLARRDPHGLVRKAAAQASANLP
jgi:HEAT repeat protein